MCMDVRLENAKESNVFNICGKVGSSTTWMKVMQDENYLMASSIDGMVSLIITFNVNIIMNIKDMVFH